MRKQRDSQGAKSETMSRAAQRRCSRPPLAAAERQAVNGTEQSYW